MDTICVQSRTKTFKYQIKKVRHGTLPLNLTTYFQMDLIMANWSHKTTLWILSQSLNSLQRISCSHKSIWWHLRLSNKLVYPQLSNTFIYISTLHRELFINEQIVEHRDFQIASDGINGQIAIFGTSHHSSTKVFKQASVYLWHSYKITTS